MSPKLLEFFFQKKFQRLFLLSTKDGCVRAYPSDEPFYNKVAIKAFISIPYLFFYLFITEKKLLFFKNFHG